MNDVLFKILIVDDDDAIRESFMDYFEDRGWAPTNASSAEEALELLKTKQFESAVVDIRLGIMNGDVFIRKAHDQAEDMLFVICTGSPDYKIPSDLMALPQVSGTIFYKPMVELGALLTEVRRKIASGRKSSDDRNIIGDKLGN